MPQTSLLLPAQHTPLATLVVAAVAAVAIMAGSLIVIGNTPAAATKPRPAATVVACNATADDAACR